MDVSDSLLARETEILSGKSLGALFQIERVWLEPLADLFSIIKSLHIGIESVIRNGFRIEKPFFEKSVVEGFNSIWFLSKVICFRGSTIHLPVRVDE